MSNLYKNIEINKYLLIFFSALFIVHNTVLVFFNVYKLIIIICSLTSLYLLTSNITFNNSQKIFLSSLLIFPYLFFFLIYKDFTYLKFAASTFICIIMFIVISDIVQDKIFQHKFNKNKPKILNYLTSATFIYLFCFIAYSTYHNISIHNNDFTTIYYQSLQTKDIPFFEHDPAIGFYILVVFKIFLFCSIKDKKKLNILFYTALLIDLFMLLSTSYYILYAFTLIFTLLFIILKSVKTKFESIKKIFLGIFIFSLFFKYLLTYYAFDLLFYFDKEAYYIFEDAYIKHVGRAGGTGVHKYLISYSQKLIGLDINLLSMYDRIFYYWMLSTNDLKIFGVLGSEYNLALTHDIFLQYFINFGVLTIFFILSLFYIWKFIQSDFSLVIFFVLLGTGMFDHNMFAQHLTVAYPFWILISILNYNEKINIK